MSRDKDGKLSQTQTSQGARVRSDLAYLRAGARGRMTYWQAARWLRLETVFVSDATYFPANAGDTRCTANRDLCWS